MSSARSVRRFVAVLGVIVGLASCDGGEAGSTGSAEGESALCTVTDEFNASTYETGAEIRAGYIAFVEGLLDADVLDDEHVELANEALDEVRSIEPTSPSVGINQYIETLGADSAAVTFSNSLTPMLEDECWTDGPTGTAPFIYFQF